MQAMVGRDAGQGAQTYNQAGSHSAYNVSVAEQGKQSSDLLKGCQIKD